MSKDLLLGKETAYPKAYSPEVLFSIPRANARSEIGIGEKLPFCGYDEWNLYELAWRDGHGSPQMAIAQICVPCESEFIIESKSLKLYANSLFYKEFKDKNSLKNQLAIDLGKAAGCEVQIELLSLDSVDKQQQLESFTDKADTYTSLDAYSVSVSAHVNVDALATCSDECVQQHYYTHRFRSLCPVTGQPDWASVFIYLYGEKIGESELAEYLLSYSEHQGFHENCVERIYLELNKHLKPREISVAARFTRRGGIDINPIRSSSEGLTTMPGRTLRQ